MVTRVKVDKSGKVEGVTFVHDGKEYFQKAKITIISAFCIETPRLLLNSACPQFPDWACQQQWHGGKGINDPQRA